MGVISESAIWEDSVLQIEVGDSVGGGPSAVANLQAQDLANRTKWLKENKFDTSNFGEFYPDLASPAMTGSATLNGTTDNTVQLTDIVTTLGLEVGDVIRIQYSGYDKLHSVESITNNDLIVVNYEHAGNRGNGSLKLEDETAAITITRIAKWFNAPIGLGQAWINMTTARVKGVIYNSLTNRSMKIWYQANTGCGGGVYVNENLVARNSMTTDGELAVGEVTIPSDSTYRLETAGAIYLVSELR